jgi:hypothetical protein
LNLDSSEDAASWRFNFHHRFVGFDLKQWLAFGDGLAFFFQPGTSFPVSWAISSAGMTTLIAIVLGR